MYSKKKEKSKRLLKKIFQTDERITENCWHSFSADEKKRGKKKREHLWPINKTENTNFNRIPCCFCCGSYLKIS